MRKETRSISRWPVLFLAVLAGALLLQACNDDGATAVPDPRNLFEGVADGKNFKTTGIISIKDSSDVFLVVGRMLGNHTVLAAFNGREETTYPIADEGPLATLAEFLNQLQSDSVVIDTTLLQEIFSDSAQLIPPGSSFLVYGIGEVQYFSNRGQIELSRFDGTINRIYGRMEVECVNALDGPKYLNAFFEDVFYLDCPTLDNCGL